MKCSGILLVSGLIIIVQQALITFLIFGNKDLLCDLQNVPKLVKKLQMIVMNSKNNVRVSTNRIPVENDITKLTNVTGKGNHSTHVLSSALNGYARSTQPGSTRLNTFSNSLDSKNEWDQPCVNIRSECRTYYSFFTLVVLFWHLTNECFKHLFQFYICVA